MINRMRGDLVQLVVYAEPPFHILLKNISNFILDYIPKKLDTSWPTETERRAREVVFNYSKENVPEDTLTYLVLNARLAKELSRVGNPKFYHQSLITANKELDANYYVGYCPIESCFTILNLRGIHVAVTRFWLDDEVRAVSARDRMANISGKVQEVIESNYNIASLSELRQKISKQVWLTSNNTYHSLIMVRGTAHFFPCDVVYHYEAWKWNH
uniref:Uncharacterized protein n=1 Tax=Ditylenchus dipsaci TaxID=166011 RepID=A0A915EM46_9BILA